MPEKHLCENCENEDTPLCFRCLVIYKDYKDYYKPKKKELSIGFCRICGIKLEEGKTFCKFHSKNKEPNCNHIWIRKSGSEEMQCQKCGKKDWEIQEPLGPIINCKFLDENQQCSNEEVDSLECLARYGKNCDEKEEYTLEELLKEENNH